MDTARKEIGAVTKSRVVHTDIYAASLKIICLQLELPDLVGFWVTEREGSAGNGIERSQWLLIYLNQPQAQYQ